MRGLKAKLIALLMTISCFAAGLGVMTATVNLVENSGVVAQAEVDTSGYTTYTFNELNGANGCTENVIYAYPTKGDALPGGDWDNRFTLESGAGLKLNGVTISGWEIKQPGDFYIVLGDKTAVAGDVFTIDGTFINETTAKKFVFNNCGLIYNGSVWKTVSAMQDIGSLGLHANSAFGAAKDVSNQLYLWPTSVTPSVQTWDYRFEPQTANSFEINGEPAVLAEMKSTGDGIFFNFNNHTIEAGDYVSVGGTYYCANNGTVYFITESHFLWNGSGWENYIEYTTIETGKLSHKDGNATCIYLKKENGEDLQIATTENNLHWETAFAFQAGSGVGVTLNGTQISMNDIKFPGSMYIGLGTTAKAGDILVVGGTFYSAKLAYKYVIEESKFIFNGTTWSDLQSSYTISNLQPTASNTKQNFVYLKINGDTNLPITDSSTFTLQDGGLVKEDGSTIRILGAASTSDGFKLNLLAANVTANVKCTLSGTFVCEALGVTYIIEECTMMWTGSAWTVYKEPINYTTYTFNELAPAGGCTNQLLYAYPTKGDTLPTGDWDNRFTLESGEGLKLNDTVLEGWEIKQPGDLYIVLNTTAVAGDIFTINGTFINEATAKKFVFNNCTLVFDGTAWKTKVDTSGYTTYDLGALVLHGNSSVGGAAKINNQLYLQRADGGALHVLSWDIPFYYESGTGFMVNGVQKDPIKIRSTGDGFFWEFSALSAGDTITIGGVFACDSEQVKYNIQDSSFVWTGSGWETYKAPINYTTYTFNKLNGANGCTNEFIYAYPTDGDALPTGDWDNRFSLELGAGLKLNDTVLEGWEIKQPGDFYIVLGKTAVAGDVFTIDGTFINETTAKKFVFNNCALVFNGTTWVTKVDEPVVEYTTHNLGSLVLHVNSSVGGAAKNNNQLYLQRADGGALPIQDWSVLFTATEDGYFKINGETMTANEIKSTDGGLFWLFKALDAGDVVTVGGTFVCDSKLTKYIIEESSFVWTGSGWAQPGEDYSDLIEGVVYDTVTIVNLGFGVEEHVNGLVEGAGLSYMASAENTTGSIKFRLGINAENISAGVYDIRFRGTAWDGIRFIIGNGMLQSYYLEAHKSVPLSSNTYYEIEIGIIDTADGNSIWIYAKVDGVLYISDLVSKTQNKYGDEGKMFSEYNTSHVSFYGNLGAVTLYDPDGVTVTYKTDYGTIEQHARRNVEYTLPQGKTYNVFIGWLAEDGTIHMAGDKITFTESMNLTAITLDFALEDGAAIRLSNSADESGIRFTTHISAEGLAKLELYGITVNSYGTLIMPYDYLGAGQAPNLSDFEAGSRVLKIVSTYSETVGDDIVYRGAMQKLNEGNYARLFAGRGFMELTINGKDIIVYTPFNTKDNVRSIRNVANKFQADTEEFNKVSAEKQGVVGAYAANNQINLMNYAAYDNNNFLNLVAWYYPELDPSNEYNNATNIAIAQKIKNAGMTAIYLDGAYHLDLGTEENIEKTRQIIKFFWLQGLYTIAFGSNASTSLAIDYSVESFPDFSDCEGFMGYLVWDEPQATSFDKLAQFANNFETVYAGTGATFMTNLLPSYATDFNEGSAGWWESSLETLKKDDYKAYVENYCKTVLSQINGGEKWLSMDSYPINKDKSLTSNFLFDLAVLKYYAMEYDAHAHAVLQSSGWKEGSNELKYRMPTEAELRMQAYTAMAFGVDSISWWSYSDKRGDNQQNPTDTDNDYYTRFANVNNELSAISAVYSAFDWKGVILGAGKDNGALFGSPDEDYEAYNAVKGQIGNYELKVSDTKHLASVATNKTNWNYLMGVMEDMNGNEGYVLCNYNSHEEDRTQTITITFDSNVTEVVIYRGGVATTVEVSNKTLTINLATGEGVIVIPSKIG